MALITRERMVVSGRIRLLSGCMALQLRQVIPTGGSVGRKSPKEIKADWQ